MTPRESEVLKVIYQLGGEGHFSRVSRRIGLSREYSSLICRTLMRENLINYRGHNALVITAKGRRVVEGMMAARLSESRDNDEWQAELIKHDFEKMVRPTILREPIIETVDAREIQSSINRLTLLPPERIFEKKAQIHSSRKKRPKVFVRGQRGQPSKGERKKSK